MTVNRYRSALDTVPHRTQADTLSWASLHAAVAEACAVRGDSRHHHRALLDDLRQEPAETWPAWTIAFRAITADARLKAAA